MLLLASPVHATGFPCRLAVFGCLFIFKVDGLFRSGCCGFPLLGTEGPASRTGSQLQGQSQGGRERDRAEMVAVWPPPVPEGLHSGVLEPLLVLPVQLMSFLCVWFRVHLGKGWPVPCSEQGMGGRGRGPDCSQPLLPPSHWVFWAATLSVTEQSPLLQTVGHVGTPLRGDAADSN